MEASVCWHNDVITISLIIWCGRTAHFLLKRDAGHLCDARWCSWVLEGKVPRAFVRFAPLEIELLAPTLVLNGQIVSGAWHKSNETQL